MDGQTDGLCECSSDIFRESTLTFTSIIEQHIYPHHGPRQHGCRGGKAYLEYWATDWILSIPLIICGDAFNILSMILRRTTDCIILATRSRSSHGLLCQDEQVSSHSPKCSLVHVVLELYHSYPDDHGT